MQTRKMKTRKMPFVDSVNDKHELSKVLITSLEMFY